ncbi:MAG: carboxyltransferase domain-containing protein, partial [Actinomycetota bacterium]
MSDVPIRLAPVGDQGVLVELADHVDDEVNRFVHVLDRSLTIDPIDGVTELVPGYVSLLMAFDPLLTDHHAVSDAARTRVAQLAEAGFEDGPSGAAPATDVGRDHTVTACFDTPFAADLAALADRCDRGVDDVISTFLGATYRVAMYGF